MTRSPSPCPSPHAHAHAHLHVARRSLSTDGLDATKFGLSQSKSSAEEWSRRGANLMENEHYSKAADAFRNAGDPVMATMASAYARLDIARSLSNVADKRRECFLVCCETGLVQCCCGEGEGLRERACSQGRVACQHAFCAGCWAS